MVRERLYCCGTYVDLRTRMLSAKADDWARLEEAQDLVESSLTLGLCALSVNDCKYIVSLLSPGTISPTAHRPSRYDVQVSLSVYLSALRLGSIGARLSPLRGL
jgi:hypothetical protein